MTLPDEAIDSGRMIAGQALADTCATRADEYETRAVCGLSIKTDSWISKCYFQVKSTLGIHPIQLVISAP